MGRKKAQVAVILGTLILLLCLSLAKELFETPPHKSGWSGYVDLHEQSPMFALPGTSPDGLTQAALELRKSASASVLPFSDDPSSSFHKDVYPTELLIKIADAEKKRRILLDFKTESAAQSYHSALVDLFTAYDAALVREIQGLSVGRATTISSFGGTSNPKHIIGVLTEGQAQLRRMRSEEDRRYACALGTQSACKAKEDWSSAPRAQLHPRASLQKTDPLPAEVASIREAMRTYTNSIGLPLEDVVTIELSHSACYPSYAPIYYDVSTHTSHLSSIPAARFTLLSDVFFYDVAKIPARFSQRYLASGTTYSHQAFHAYICEDFGREAELLLTIFNARKLLENTSWQNLNKNLSLTQRDVLEAIRVFTEDPIASEHSYREVISATNRLLAEERMGAPSAPFTEEQLKKLKSLTLDARTHSSTLEQMVGYFDDLQMSTYVTATLDEYRTSVFYMLRTGTSALLMLGGETGPFREDPSLFIKRTEREVAPNGYTMYSFRRELKDTESLSELLTINERSYRAVFDPLVAELKIRRATLQ